VKRKREHGSKTHDSRSYRDSEIDGKAQPHANLKHILAASVKLNVGKIAGIFDLEHALACMDMPFPVQFSCDMFSLPHIHPPSCMPSPHVGTSVMKPSPKPPPSFGFRLTASLIRSSRKFRLQYSSSAETIGWEIFPHLYRQENWRGKLTRNKTNACMHEYSPISRHS